MEACDYPTLLGSDELESVHRLVRVKDPSSLEGYDKAVYDELQQAYEVVKNLGNLTVRQRDILVAYGFASSSNSGREVLGDLARELGVFEKDFFRLLSQPVLERGEMLEDTVSDPNIFLDRLVTSVGKGNRFEFRNLDDMFDDRSLRLSVMPDGVDGIDFVQVGLDGRIGIAYHYFDEDDLLTEDMASGDSLSMFGTGHLQEILHAVDGGLGRLLDVSDHLKAMENEESDENKLKNNDMMTVDQLEAHAADKLPFNYVHTFDVRQGDNLGPVISVGYL